MSETFFEMQRGDALISSDPRRLDIDMIHDFLSRESHWAMGIPRDLLERAIANSLSFGLFLDGRQVGYARVISDYATFGYLCDVFVLPEFRGRKLSNFLVEAILAHPQLQGLRRFSLVTRDAPWLYRKYGWRSAEESDLYYMDITNRDIYRIK